MAFSAADAAGAGTDPGWWRQRIRKVNPRLRGQYRELVAALETLQASQVGGNVRAAADRAVSTQYSLAQQLRRIRSGDQYLEAALQELAKVLYTIMNAQDDIAALNLYGEALARGEADHFAEDHGDRAADWDMAPRAAPPLQVAPAPRPPRVAQPVPWNRTAPSGGAPMGLRPPPQLGRYRAGSLPNRRARVQDPSYFVDVLDEYADRYRF